MDEDEARGPELERAAENNTRIDRKLAERALLKLLIGEQHAAGVEKQDAQHLVRQRSHRRDQILPEFGGEGIDRCRIEIAAQALEHRVSCCGKKGAPSHRVFVGDAEVGAAWSKTSQDQRPYLSVKLDDPSFTAPIFAQLFAGEDGEHDLVWNRQPRRSEN